MNGRVIFVIISAAFLFSVPTAFADPSLISHWKLDESSGDTAYDSAGNNDGTLHNYGLEFDWTTGQIGGALEFPGWDYLAYVTVGDKDNLEQQELTLSYWAKKYVSPYPEGGVGKGNISGGIARFSYKLELEGSTAKAVISNTSDSGFTVSCSMGDDDWHMWTMTAGSGMLALYKDGAFANSTSYTGLIGYDKSNNDFMIGSKALDNYQGKIDDVRFYNRILSVEEIGQLYQEGLGYIASVPNPITKAREVEPDVVLSWWPGKNADSHDVYFGTDYNDVNDADTNSPEYKGNFDVNYWDPCCLDIDTSYYWRIDEVNDANLWRGNIWNFKTPGPVLELSASQFDFYAVEGSANPNDQILGISNSGVGTLNWTASCDCDWLSIEPNSGNSTGEIDDVNLSVDISGLTVGVYGCNLTISDPNSSNSPQMVEITLVAGDSDGELYVPLEYPTIQDAIDMAYEGDNVIIAPGTYTGSGNRDLDFGGKAITVRSTDPNDPCVVAATVIDCESATGHRGFYFHSGEGPNSIVSGLTITRGKILDDPAKGGGIYCEGSSPTIENCVITSNRAHGVEGSGDGKEAYGGGVYCTSNSGLTLIGCTIVGNTAAGGAGGDKYCADDCSGDLGPGGGGAGGGIYSSADSNVMILDCTITNNTVQGGNGGIEYWYTSGWTPTFSDDGGAASGGGICGSGITVENCIVMDNEALGGEGDDGGGDAEGGGINCGSGAIIYNCIIANNGAFGGDLPGYGPPPPGSGGDADGGGINCGSGTTINNCTIVNNTAVEGGYDIYYGLSRGDGIKGEAATGITNCILWGNGDDLYGCSASYSCIEDGDAGVGNISSYPEFVDLVTNDFHLKQIAAGQAVDSPCVDAGSDTAKNLGMDIFTTRTDQLPDKGLVDMGYHYPSIVRSADIDENWYVDFLDYAILANDWLTCSDPCDSACTEAGLLDGDITADYYVNIYDLEFFVYRWLDCYVTEAGIIEPSDNETYVDPNIILVWSAGNGAIYHDVYFGTDVNAVADADYLSEAFKGTISETSFDPNTLSLNTNYYWRIDEAGQKCITKGEVWSFTTWDPESGLVGWWEFEEGSGSIAGDSSGNGNDGTIYGATWATGQIGGALDFNGVSDYVNCGNDSSLKPPLPITISAWVRLSGSGKTQYIVVSDNQASDYYGVWFTVRPDNTLGVSYGDGGYPGAVNRRSKIGTTALSEDTWYHVAVVIEGSTDMSFYINGADDGGTYSGSGGSLVYSSGSALIGKEHNSAYPFDGKIDDVRIYNRALSEGEVEDLYEGGL